MFKAHFVGYEHHRCTPFEAHADQFSTRSWTGGKGKLSCGIERRLDDYSLAGLEPIHPAGQIYHLVVTFDSPTIAIYLNAAAQTLGASTINTNTMGVLRIGRSDNVDGHAQGWVGPVAIYQGVTLTAQQVSQHYRLAGAWVDYAYRVTDPVQAGAMAL